MARGFRFPGATGGQHDPWFRIGTLEVTTTMFVVIASTVVMVTHVFSAEIPAALALDPALVVRGQIWRVATWPLANFIGFFTILNIFFFWYFGSQLESDLGRVRMARLLLWTTVLTGLAALPISALSGFNEPYVGGIGTLELLVLLVWIADHPHARFFFNIPAWLLGAVLVALPILSMLASRPPLLLALLHFLVSLGIAALVARHYGLLSDYAALPRIGGGQRRPRRSRATPSGSSVVAGPWAGSSAPRVDSDRAKLDALLDKISESGMDSLTSSERKQLDVLRRRIRGE